MPDKPATTPTAPPASPTWDAAHWDELQGLYHLAAEAPPGERTRILHRATDNKALLQRVLDLLESEDAANTGTADTGAALQSGSSPQAQAPAFASVPAGQRVGAYTLLRLIGTGGLGSVYLAERVRGGAVQRCALKVLSLHAAGPAMEARFLREQQIIASLDHPHITRMLDAGFSSEGQAFLTMEFVDGSFITEHCDAHRLSIQERIDLFLQICEAVAYAHRMLVVHLDLKPANILVSAAAGAKLLDFGTSKLVASDAALTATVLATPAYASPEQLRNQPVSTACDVYGLGAVLYELLTGARPWGSASPSLILEHAFREHEPAPITEAVTDEAAAARGESSAAALRQRLRGDLQSITAHCLRSSPANRYASADRLAEDLRRYLQRRPVLARKRTVSYRVGKFLRRNRAAVLLTVAIVLMLLTAAAFGYARQQEALREGERAERMQNFLYSVLRLANTNYTGHPATTIPEFLQLAVKALPEYIHEPADRRAAQLSLGESMFDNSDFQQALPVLFAVRDEAHRAGDLPTEAEATAFAGMAESEQGHYEEAGRLLDTAMSWRDRKGVSPAQRLWIVGFYVSNRYNSGARVPADAALLQSTLNESRRSAIPDRELGWALGNLATLYSRSPQQDEARRLALESLDVLRRQPYTACDQAFSLNLLGDLDMYRGNDAAAIQNYEQGYRTILACKGPEDLSTLELQIPLARLLVKNHRSVEAVQLLGPSIAIWRKVLPGNPEIGYALTTLAQAHMQQGDAAAAAALARDALAAQRSKLQHNSVAMALTYAVLAQGEAGQGNTREALASAEEADTIFASLPTLSAISRGVQADNKAVLARLRHATH